MHLSSSGLTHKGQVRDDNQDSIYHEESNSFRSRVFLVADGMGGAKGGQTASSMATSIVPRVFTSNLAGMNPEQALRHAVEAANRQIHELSQEDQRLRGMGTTLVGLFMLENGTAMVVNVGDSRCYLFRKGELHQVTEDHSLVQEMVRKGQISVEQAREHNMRNMLSRALGTSPEVSPDLFHIKELETDDVFLLCSDGLHGVVSTEQMKGILAQSSDISEKTKQFVQAALDGGGPDNISAVLVHLVHKNNFDPEDDIQEITLNTKISDIQGTPGSGWRVSKIFRRLLGK